MLSVTDTFSAQPDLRPGESPKRAKIHATQSLVHFCTLRAWLETVILSNLPWTKTGIRSKRLSR